MKRILVILFVALLAGIFYWQFRERMAGSLQTPVAVPTQEGEEIKAVSVIAENLTIPWDIAFLPSGEILVTERPGRLVKIGADGVISEIEVEGVRHIGEGGLLGMTLHPEFETNNFLYLYMTSPNASGGTQNRVERYVFDGNRLSGREVIFDAIPGAIYHDGGRIEFGSDGFLYITTGDATQENLAQDRDSLAGKILRITENGEIPEGNPFGTAVYSMGHRNPQGLAWDGEGRLWSTEHGRSGVSSGFDEVNLIEPGKNYGWPEIQGDETASGMQTPKLQSGATTTWAPASAAYLNGSLFFGGLRSETLYEAVLAGENVTELKEHFTGEFGRIRTVRLGPDGFLYLTTSNQDGRGEVSTGDDKIIRVNPDSL